MVKHRPEDLRLPEPVVGTRRGSSADPRHSPPPTPAWSNGSPSPYSPYFPDQKQQQYYHLSQSSSPTHLTPPSTPSYEQISRTGSPTSTSPDAHADVRLLVPPQHPIHLQQRRKSSNPLVFVRRRSKKSLFLVFALIVIGWFFLTSTDADPHSRRQRSTGSLVAASDAAHPIRGAMEGEQSKPMFVMAKQRLWTGIKGKDNVKHDALKPLHRSDSNLYAQVQIPVPSPSPAVGFRTSSQELAALLLFLAAPDLHALPLDLDPSQPLPPDSVLEEALPIDSEEREAMMAKIEQECWSMFPVVIVGKAGEVWTRESREILGREEYFGKRRDGLGEFYVDKRADSEILQPFIHRLLASTPAMSAMSSVTLPQILVAGTRIGSFDELKALHDSNQLGPMLQNSGAHIGEDLKKRLDKERLILKGHGKLKARNNQH